MPVEIEAGSDTSTLPIYLGPDCSVTGLHLSRFVGPCFHKGVKIRGGVAEPSYWGNRLAQERFHPLSLLFNGLAQGATFCASFNGKNTDISEANFALSRSNPVLPAFIRATSSNQIIVDPASATSLALLAVSKPAMVV